MLGGSSKGVMSIVYGFIVVAILLVFLVQFRPSSGQQTASLQKQCAANIRGQCITPKDFYASLGLIAPRSADDARLKAMGIRRLVLEGIVERQLLNADAERLGVTVSDDDINAELAKGRFHVSLPVARMELPYYLGLAESSVRLMPVNDPETKEFSYKLYERTVRAATNRSPKEFKVMQRHEIIAERMRDIIRSWARVSETEARELFNRENSTASIEYVALQRPYFESHFLDSSPQAVKQWAAEHKDELDKVWEARKGEYPPGCRRISHIMMRFGAEQGHEGHGHEGEQPDRVHAQQAIEKALARVQAGETFASVAREVSQDHHSAQRGGALGCFDESKAPKEFSQAAAALKNPGDISAVVETPQGFHIIKLTDVIPDDAAKAAEVGRMAVAADLMAAMKTDTMMAQAGKQIREQVQAGKPMEQAVRDVLGALFQPGADKKPAKKDQEQTAEQDLPRVETVDSFTAERSPIPNVAPGENAAAMVFKMDKPGVPSDLVKLQDGYAVVRVTERKVPGDEEFQAKRDEYMERLLRAKQQDYLESYVARLRLQAANDIRIDERYATEPKGRDEE